ncbi:MAG: RNA methyltransferase [Flavobacteriaceae bacterium]
MLTRAIAKQIQQLKQKKHRDQQGQFCAEGLKSVQEGIQSGLKLVHCLVTEDRLVESLNEDWGISAMRIDLADMKKLSHLSTPSAVLGLFEKPKSRPLPSNEWIVALDDIQDPGNLGTLMRTLDWFGFKHLLCSAHTVDCYSAKVVQSSMGSYARMNCVYDDLAKALQQLEMPIVGADLKGVSLEQFDPAPKGVLVLGNEGHGISDAVASLLTQRITIPSAKGSAVESLNAAISGAVIAYTISNRLGFLR